MDLHFFDRHADYSIVERRLPHWGQAGVICFLTWRTCDSIPASVLEAWRSERSQWLRLNQIDPVSRDWRQQLQTLPQSVQSQFYCHFSKRWHNALDASHGACVLRNREYAEMIGQSLLFFDDDRYELSDFVVMPNHVHLLVAFPTAQTMLKQCTSWKHFTARAINRKLGSCGRFWQQDGFDHLVRSEEQYIHFREYIANNGVKAGLSQTEYLHYSKQPLRCA